MFIKLVFAGLLLLSPVFAQDVTVRLELVLIDDPATETNEARETIRVLNDWRLNQIIGLTEDGEKIIAFNSLKDVLAEELNRYISAILTDICNTRMDKCPAHLKDDYMDAEAAVVKQRRRTKDVVKVE